MIVSPKDATVYFWHPAASLWGNELPDVAEYRVDGDVCLAFHQTFWPDVWMVHLGAKRDGWGRLDKSTMLLLNEFWSEKLPVRIVAWVCKSNRAVIALAKRLGFVEDGQFADVLMMGWQKCQ